MASNMKNDDDDPALDLSDLIRDLGHGATNRLGSAKLADLLNACRATGKKGSMTIVIGVAAGQDGIAEVRASIKTTRPEPALPGGNYFVNKEGALVTEDPRQASLPLPKVVPPARVINIDSNGGK